MKLRLRIIQTSKRVKNFHIEIDESLIPIFNFDTTGKVHNSIKQLEPIKIEIMQLCKEIYNKNCKELFGYIPSLIMMDWDKQIVPLLRHSKIQTLLDQ